MFVVPSSPRVDRFGSSPREPASASPYLVARIDTEAIATNQLANRFDRRRLLRQPQVYLSLADAVVREAYRAGETTAVVPEVSKLIPGPESRAPFPFKF